ERNFWAEPGLLNRCILRSRRRVGWCEFSAPLFFHRPRSCRRSIPISRTAALYDRRSSVTNRSGTKAYFLRSLRISFSAACLLRFDWTSTSRGIVTLASFTCQWRDALIGRTQRNQWLAEFESGAGHLENPLFLPDVTMPSWIVNFTRVEPRRRRSPD